MTAYAPPSWQDRAGALQISKDDIVSFHHSHFSTNSLACFAADFLTLPPKGAEFFEGYNEGWEDKDDLGLYPDGVKRTLTDEQIEIFRHSELRELQKQQEKAKASKLTNSDNTGDGQIREPTDTLTQNTRPHSSRVVKKKKKKGGRSTIQEPKPDLRKRTWDVVDVGLDSLDYD